MKKRNSYSFESAERAAGISPTLKTNEKNGGAVHVGMDDTVEPVGNVNSSVEEVPKVKNKAVGVFELFRFADKYDMILMSIGLIFSIAHGSAFAVNLLIYGQVIDIFTRDFIRDSIGNMTSNVTLNATAVPPEVPLFDKMQPLVYQFVILAGCVLAVGYVQIVTWSLTKERQSRRIRRLFFHSIMRQDMEWFDLNQSSELTTRMADDINNISEGMGDKVATFIQWSTGFFAGYALAFSQGWKLALVILAVAPLMIISAAVMGSFIRTFTARESNAYAAAGAVAEEVLGSIRTVAAFGGEKKECDRYNSNLVEAQKVGIQKGIVNGTGSGFIWLTIFSAFALAFWYGAKLIREDGYTPGNILQVFFGVLIGSMSLGQAAPVLETFGTARGAAAIIYAIIDTIPSIDSSSEEGKRPASMEGNVEFEDVEFNYPSRVEVPILQGMNFQISRGQTVALVGPSGCGKSTVVQLIQRFYDPLKGQVRIDGQDIRDLHIKTLRQHVGVVSQEPVLFATTIAENIRYGREGVTQQEIEQAAKEANAHNFIRKLPDKYETLVGERGAQLSGGQKQRIAIARALVRNPTILLLDEATSALDTESEAVVQAALDKASEGRTTLVVAHRLTTVRNADLILGIKNGQVCERGTHDELMAQHGLYYELVMLQTKTDEKEQANPDVMSGIEGTTGPNKNTFHSRLSSWCEDEGHIHASTPLLDAEEIEKEIIPEKFDQRRMTGSIKRKSLRRMGSNQSEKRASFFRMKSVESEAEELREIEKEIEDELPDIALKEIIRLNAPEAGYIIAGCVACIVTGAVHPLFSVVFSEILKVFAEQDPEKQKEAIIIYALVFVGIGLVTGVNYIIQNYSFAVSGERLTMRLRQMAFKAMLRQEIAYFDDHKNQVGALTARLATDASMVKTATGIRLGTIIQALANMGTALVIAFVFGWKLAFVVMAFLPILIASGMLQTRIMTGFAKGDKERIEEGGKIATEAIDNIATVAALTKENTFAEKYNSHFKDMFKEGVKKSHLFAVSYGISASVVFFGYAAAFSFGAWLVQQREMEFYNVFRVFTAITFGGQSLGRATSYLPDYSKAKLSAAKMLTLFKRVPEIDSSSTAGAKPDAFKGEVNIKDVVFSYPTRPEVTVMKKMNISVNPGETLALVGSSGCGKSTSIQLLERFYDPLEGQVLLDGIDTTQLNLQFLRSQIGLVSQEPVLFDCSIRENIAYGDNLREVSTEEVIEAAKSANIHNFVKSLPLGYETGVGDKGTQLSGGQKQRIAIARALIRNPKVLLLDEATSALDSESEKVVQEALDKAQEGRTSIVIAHRLSTIQNADCIAVIFNGQVVEKGTHSELMALQGHYYTLNYVQK